ncbi:hypothetical protein [Neobacillus niacini]|uniref:hypothetical protein n=1 Tax=Neobacillus niacini TaxID=86668 RepID=UPI00285DCF9A|nr:hypothetical protein [Neobacillus niacini]MDR6999533.1 hypothetical protein [Neobacillus niacini]
MSKSKIPFLYFGRHCPNEWIFPLKGKSKVVSLPERVDIPVKREKKSGFIARTSWYAR